MEFQAKEYNTCNTSNASQSCRPLTGNTFDTGNTCYTCDSFNTSNTCNGCNTLFKSEELLKAHIERYVFNKTKSTIPWHQSPSSL